MTPGEAVAARAPDLARQWRAEAAAVWSGEFCPRSDGEVERRERAKVLRECAAEFEAAAPLITAAGRDRLLRWMHRQAIELATYDRGLSDRQRSARDDISQALIAAVAHISACGDAP